MTDDIYRAPQRVCDLYMENVKAFLNNTTVHDPYAGVYREPDKRLLDKVESKVIPLLDSVEKIDHWRRTLVAMEGCYEGNLKWDQCISLRNAITQMFKDDSRSC